MELFVLLAQQSQVEGNPILTGALSGAIFGGIIGGLVGVLIWGVRKLTGGQPRK